MASFPVARAFSADRASPAPPSDPGDSHDDDGPPLDAESTARASAAAAALVRWGTFSCALTPVTLLACGTPVTTALGAAAGLAAVTAACGALLHRSQHAYAQHESGPSTTGGPGPHRGRHSRTGTGLHRGGRHWANQSEPPRPN